MDPEPGRCRRTDGKKWRCYQSVVPNKKYCEKHMHRGRKRSRKLVEDVTMDAPNGNENLGKNTESSPAFEVPAILNGESQPLNEPSRVVIEAPGLNNTSAERDEKVARNDEAKRNMVVKESIAAIKLAPGVAFSPKSVLQDGHRCSEVEHLVKSPGLVPQRCCRTDGWKWQCYNAALPAQRYCAQHINRGLKKPVTSLSATRKAIKAHITSSTTKLSELPTRLDDPKSKVKDSASGSISSSDPSSKTTVSDDSADIWDLIAVSP